MDRQTSATRTWTEPELNELASAIAYSILLAAFAEYGITRRAVAAACGAVALTDAIAFEEDAHARPVRDD